MSEDMINIEKMTSLIKTRCNRIMQSNLNLDICDKFKFDCVARCRASLCVERNTNREGVASGSTITKLTFCLNKLAICKKSLNIIKCPYATCSFHNMLFKYTKKNHLDFNVRFIYCGLFIYNGGGS